MTHCDETCSEIGLAFRIGLGSDALVAFSCGSGLVGVDSGYYYKFFTDSLIESAQAGYVIAYRILVVGRAGAYDNEKFIALTRKDVSDHGIPCILELCTTCFISLFPMNKSVSTTVSYRRIWQIAYPILLSVLMEQLINLTDTAFLGRVGQVELGASALSGIFYISIFVIGLGFGQGTQILMARRNGERCYSRISGIFYHSLAFLLFLALVLCVFTSLFGPQVLRSIISNPEVAEAANNYLQWRVYGMFMAYVAILFRSFYVATVNTRMLTLNSLLMVGTNVVFDYILIFGYGPVPALGISGAAIASVIAETVSMLFFIIYTRARVDYRKYGFHRMPRARLSLFSHILGISVWTMMQDFLSLATWFIFFLAVEHLGAAELAASNIIRNISSVGPYSAT